MNLRATRDRWNREKPLYDKLCQRVVDLLKRHLREQAIFAEVMGRTKDTSSLLKKILKKQCSYEEVTDKAGARVIVRFRHEVNSVCTAIDEGFDVLRKEDKEEGLGHNQVGYLAVHFDIRLKSLPPDNEDAVLTPLPCEIQVHTLCQNLWAFMDHELSYKPVFPTPEEIRRKIYLLNALLEIADRNFDSISAEVAALPGAYAAGTMLSLEKHFYRFTDTEYDPELSQQVLEDLRQLFSSIEIAKMPSIIDNFVAENETKLQSIFEEYRGVDDGPLFLSQPEVLLIFQRLESDPFVLQELWSAHYPHEELERLAIVWGKPLD